MPKIEVIRVGNKPAMSYALVATRMFNEGYNTIVVWAKGGAKSKAVDVVRIIRERFFPVKVRDITTGTVENSEYGEIVNTTYIEIVLEK